MPGSPYAAAKWAASGFARMAAELYGLPVTLARLFMVYGPGQRDRGKLVPHVIASLLRGEAPALSSGRREVDWVFVEDVVDALIVLGAAPELQAETIDIGSGRLVTIRALVERIVASLFHWEGGTARFSDGYLLEEIFDFLSDPNVAVICCSPVSRGCTSSSTTRA